MAVVVVVHFLLSLRKFFRICTGVEKQALDFLHIQYQPFGSEMNAREKYDLLLKQYITKPKRKKEEMPKNAYIKIRYKFEKITKI